ncbi:MAG: ATP-dependent RNA helicase HrpA, partial [Dehalococcoidia bacterium]|nr:ATP-dependent RNA helicase HrpA [Dehalococcoidia bacterium]
TDGLLLNEIQRDRTLKRYACVIVDEAHERSLNIDFILGCLKLALARRRDLKVIVTSATIDVAAFADYFDGAPVVEVSGRGYPVETVYLQAVDAQESALVDCLERIARDSPAGHRDILVFQSGEREIFDADRFDILPLYARLPSVEQRRIFAPGDRQRVVLATNVAETSITVPNIGYVVDPGLARISRYSYRAKLQRLPIEAISQASAAQRAGRCGRVAPGVCYRLYAEADYHSRPAYTDPELKRTNLAAVVLTMRAFRLGDVEAFPFIEPPDGRAVRDAVRLLHELEALADDRLTEVGKTMARLPVDPRLARVLIEAGRTGALAEALIVVSALSAQDPRLRPLEHRARCSIKRRPMRVPPRPWVARASRISWPSFGFGTGSKPAGRRCRAARFGGCSRAGS